MYSYKVFLPCAAEIAMNKVELVGVFRSSTKLKKGQKIVLYAEVVAGELLAMEPGFKIEKIEKVQKNVMNLFLKKVK